MGLHIPLWFTFCMDGRLFFWSSITMIYPDGGEERLASHLYPLLFVYFSGGPRMEQWSRFWFSFPQRNTRLS